MISTLVLFSLIVSQTFATCPDHTFLTCVLRLKAQRVPFERNILNVVFNIKTEAKLLHTCRVYSSIIPCFQSKINECGDEKQKRMLSEVSKMLMFICSPFSLNRQRLLIEHQGCISSVLRLPASTGCRLGEHPLGVKVLQCKKHCSTRPTDFICTMRTWISEQNVCTFKDIEEKCGIDAAQLYHDMQVSVFEPQFPVLCEHKNISSVASSTVDSIVIEPLEQPSTTTWVAPVIRTDKPDLTKNEVKIYYRKPDRKEKKYPVIAHPYSSTWYPPTVTWAPVTSPWEPMTTTEQTTVTTPVVWTKKPNQIKTKTAKPVWRKPQSYVIPAGQPNFETSTMHSLATPRSYKVINLIKSLIPENLPSQLSNFIENHLEMNATEGRYSSTTNSEFYPEDHYHTPSEVVETTTKAATRLTTTFATLVPAFRPPKPVKSATKWRPWYLGGEDIY